MAIKTKLKKRRIRYTHSAADDWDSIPYKTKRKILESKGWYIPGSIEWNKLPEHVQNELIGIPSPGKLSSRQRGSRLSEVRKEIISVRGKLKRSRTPNDTEKYMNKLVHLENERDYLVESKSKRGK